MSKVLVLVLALGFAQTGWSAIKIEGCIKSGFTHNAWPNLVSLAPHLQVELNKIARHSGHVQGTVFKLTNCRVEWPVDENGKSITGHRTVVMDKVWLGANGKSRHHGGIRLHYWLEHKDYGSHITIQRRIKGIVYCRGSNICKRLGIPFPGQKKIPDSMPTKPKPWAPETLTEFPDT